MGDDDVTRVALEVAVNAGSLRSVTRVTPVTRGNWWDGEGWELAAGQVGERPSVNAFGPDSPTDATNEKPRSRRSHCGNRAA